jgi:hypothetical protein
VRLGHGEAGAQERNSTDTVGRQLVTDGIADVQHGHVDVCCDGVVNLVRRVACHEHAFRSRSLKTLRSVDVEFGNPIPIIRVLERDQVSKVDAFDRQFRAVESAEPLRDAPVDVFVIKRGRRPARPADDSKLAQSRLPLPHSRSVVNGADATPGSDA